MAGVLIAGNPPNDSKAKFKLIWTNSSATTPAANVRSRAIWAPTLTGRSWPRAAGGARFLNGGFFRGCAMGRNHDWRRTVLPSRGPASSRRQWRSTL